MTNIAQHIQNTLLYKIGYFINIYLDINKIISKSKRNTKVLSINEIFSSFIFPSHIESKIEVCILELSFHFYVILFNKVFYYLVFKITNDIYM